MTIYAGETVKVFSRALNWDNSPVTPSDAAVVVTVYDELGLTSVQDAPMAWSNVTQRWEYDWLPALPGSYRIEVTVNGPGQYVSKEVRAVTVASARVVVPAPGHFIRGD